MALLASNVYTSDAGKASAIPEARPHSPVTKRSGTGSTPSAILFSRRTSELYSKDEKFLTRNVQNLRRDNWS